MQAWIELHAKNYYRRLDEIRRWRHISRKFLLNMEMRSDAGEFIVVWIYFINILSRIFFAVIAQIFLSLLSHDSSSRQFYYCLFNMCLDIFEWDQDVRTYSNTMSDRVKTELEWMLKCQVNRMRAKDFHGDQLHYWLGRSSYSNTYANLVQDLTHTQNSILSSLPASTLPCLLTRLVSNDVRIRFKIMQTSYLFEWKIPV